MSHVVTSPLLLPPFFPRILFLGESIKCWHGPSCFPAIVTVGGRHGKYALSEGATGPWAVWRPIEDAAAIVGNTLNLGGRQRMGVSRKFLGRGFQGITLEATEVPQTAALGDFPSARDQPDAAAARAERSVTVGEIFLYPGCVRPDDSRACPTQLPAKPVEIRTAYDWSEW